jgi:hypothetical protein
MQGLIYNLLAELAHSAGCEEEAWDVALTSAALDLESARDPAFDDAPFDDTDHYALTSALPSDAPAERDSEELFVFPAIAGGREGTFSGLLRSGSPFREEDWAHIAGEPLPLRRGSLRRESRPPPPDKTRRR